MRAQFVITLTYAFLGFPLFYFVYKFGNPEPLAHDFFQYYRLYKDWDIDNVNAPFNMRLLGSFFVHLLYHSGAGYNTETAFDVWIPAGFDKRVWFCAVFFNFLCVVFTAGLLCRMAARASGQRLTGLIAGAVLLLSFGTMFYAIMPLTDAFSMLLFAWTLWHYQTKSRLAMVPLMLCILQREYVILAFTLISLVEFMMERERFTMELFMWCVVCFVVYFILRRTVFHTPALAFQTSASHLWNSFLHPGLIISDYLRQMLLTLNIFVLYLALVFFKLMRGSAISKKWLLMNSLLLAQLALLSFAAQLGNNTGRYLYIASPFLIYCLIIEANFLFLPKPTELV